MLFAIHTSRIVFTFTNTSTFDMKPPKQEPPHPYLMKASML